MQYPKVTENSSTSHASTSTTGFALLGAHQLKLDLFVYRQPCHSSGYLPSLAVGLQTSYHQSRWDCQCELTASFALVIKCLQSNCQVQQTGQQRTSVTEFSTVFNTIANPVHLPCSTPMRLGQPGSIPALVLPSGSMAARHRKGVTAERFFFISTECAATGRLMFQWLDTSKFLVHDAPIIHPDFDVYLPAKSDSQCLSPVTSTASKPVVPQCSIFSQAWGEMAQLLERKFIDRKVRGLNTTSVCRLPLSTPGQFGNIPALLQPSGGS
ncbi:hypothetical protein T265_11100 [Opisthorchis viverrini]|uniref:Uncharacterized protein n=1 Tax=Opisthorchis viverrini TaxID=6198 RepID=A0A074Z069_OPIVI|nr:hypothetical protein T265_11100 [Opisthorchis viverrini]KER20318.1 hypothetical protein T265_11100 [Opisthorchis viverrini]